MNDPQKDEQEENTLAKLDFIIQKKKEEIAGLQKILSSIEDADVPPESDKKEEFDVSGEPEP